MVILVELIVILVKLRPFGTGGEKSCRNWGFLKPRGHVLLTPTHVAIVMECAAAGELFERICNAGRFSEDELHK
uniref:Uncharacterized protein n=1 Tax=Salix viminalis TaxID=40686 RepID=A0A6N2KV07_SALVM